MIEIMGQRYLGVGYSVGIDVERDRVTIEAGGAHILDLAPKHWFMGDQELRDLLTTAVMNALGPGYPPPFTEPAV